MWNLLYQIQQSVTATIAALADLSFSVDFLKNNRGVTKIVAGTRVSISPTTGIGDVTVTAAIAPVTSLVAGSRITLSPSNGLGDVTITAAAAPVTQITAGTNVTVSGGGLGNVTVNAANPPVTQLTAGTNITVSGGGLGNVTVTAAGSGLKYFEGANSSTYDIYLSAGYRVYSWTTGLTKLVSWKVVAVCQANDGAGAFLAGEEYDLTYTNGQQFSTSLKFTPSSGVALVGIIWLTGASQPALNWLTADNVHFDVTAIDKTKWRFKLYAVGI